MRRVIQIALAAVVLFIIGALSRVPYTPESTSSAVLRLSWRFRGEAVQRCRNRTPAELEKLPIHMRTPQVCTGRVSSYRLELEVDDQELPVMELHAAGARADRPIYVYRELKLAPGPHEIEVEFYSTHSPEIRTKFEERVQVERGELVLITYDADTKKLDLRRANQKY